MSETSPSSIAPYVGRPDEAHSRGLPRWAFALAATPVLFAACESVNQRPDLDFVPPISQVAYADGAGSRVGIDAAHHNFHTADGRYATFAQLLRRDGYRVSSFAESFSAASLAEVEVLVISNALHSSNVADWILPNPAAFSAAEVAALKTWVESGGSLMLIADHMPFPGAAETLGRAFGLLFSNGYAVEIDETTGKSTSTIRYTSEDGSLADHVVTRGRSLGEGVDRVIAFGGQAFRATEEARERVEPLMRLRPGSRVLLTWLASHFDDKTPSIAADDMLQGAVLRVGAGRVAVFGEAAMFSAQVLERKKGRKPPVVTAMGMNEPEATGNAQFALNVMHWLSGILE